MKSQWPEKAGSCISKDSRKNDVKDIGSDQFMVFLANHGKTYRILKHRKVAWLDSPLSKIILKTM